MASTAFRRLEGKTQVFAPSDHDHFRTRLTHTLEVASLSRTLAVRLGANELLAESIALAHDLGHPPFGHAGEQALAELMSGGGGFNHNLHALRVVEYLEHPFPWFRGLNLTLATREGLRAHQSPFDKPAEAKVGPSVEAQVVSIADRIAYNSHDLEDAIGAGLIDAAALQEVDLWREAWDRAGCNGERIHAVRRVVLDAMVDRMLADIIDSSRPMLAPLKSLDDVHAAGSPLIKLSQALGDQFTQWEGVLANRVYRSPALMDHDRAGKNMVTDLFCRLVDSPGDLPQRFRSRVEAQGVHRVACDYIAGMTDRYCRAAFERLIA